MDELVVKRVLFVDDEPNVLMGLQRLLRVHRNEWKMAFVSSGDEALELLSREAYDIIVTDLRMPRMSGVELLETVKQTYPEMTRFILSGHADTDIIIQSVNAAHQFLAKPCSVEVLEQAVDCAFSLRRLFKSAVLSAVVQDGSSLPTLPDLYYKLTAALQSPDSSSETIAEIISRDVSMSAKILQLVNSAFFSLSRHVDSIDHAVALLGAETINNILIMTSVFEKFSDELVARFDIQEIYAHSLRVGAATAKLISVIFKNRKKSAEAMLAGMMHDLGKLVFIHSGHAEWAEIYLGRKQQEEPLYELERNALGVTHAEVGAYLLTLWGLSNHVVEAVAFHHEPRLAPGGDFGVLAALHLANAVDLSCQELSGGETLVDLDYLERVGVGDRIVEYEALCRDEILG